MKSTTVKSCKIVTYFLFSGIPVNHVERRGRRKGEEEEGKSGARGRGSSYMLYKPCHHSTLGIILRNTIHSETVFLTGLELTIMLDGLPSEPQGSP